MTKQLDLCEIIAEAKKHNRTFTLEDAQDVIDTKPTWAKWDETVEEAVADYIAAFCG